RCYRDWSSDVCSSDLDMIADEKRSELEKLDGVRKTFLEAWPKLSGRTREPPTVRLQVIKGRAQIYRTLQQFVSTAKAEVLAFTRSEERRVGKGRSPEW